MRRLAVVAAWLALGGSAQAYVRAKTSTGTPLAWRSHCPVLVMDSLANPMLDPGRAHAALERSAVAWNDPTEGCDRLRIQVGGTVSGKDVAFDGTSLVLWRLPGFCDNGKHARDEVCLSPDAAAVTTVFYYDKPNQPQDGEMLETDVEINATYFAFADDGSQDHIDLQNTLTHELGHVLGLDHTCYTMSGIAPPVDAKGQPVPFCYPLSALPPDVTEATMFNFESPGETAKRVPREEEWRGTCDMYANRPATCEPVDTGGCQFVPLRHGVSIGVGLLVIAGLIVRSYLRRRRR